MTSRSRTPEPRTCLRLRRAHPYVEVMESRVVPSLAFAPVHREDSPWGGQSVAAIHGRVNGINPDVVVKLDVVALHELGHALGLDHIDDHKSIMNDTYNRNYDISNFMSDPAVSMLRGLYETPESGPFKDSEDPHPGDGKVEVTYSLAPDSIPSGDWGRTLVEQLDRWAIASGGRIAFSAREDSGAPFDCSGDPQNATGSGDIRISSRSIDGAGRVLAQAYLPDTGNGACAGDIQIDSDETWVGVPAQVSHPDHHLAMGSSPGESTSSTVPPSQAGRQPVAPVAPEVVTGRRNITLSAVAVIPIAITPQSSTIVPLLDASPAQPASAPSSRSQPESDVLTPSGAPGRTMGQDIDEGDITAENSTARPGRYERPVGARELPPEQGEDEVGEPLQAPDSTPDPDPVPAFPADAIEGDTCIAIPWQPTDLSAQLMEDDLPGPEEAQCLGPVLDPVLAGYTVAVGSFFVAKLEVERSSPRKRRLFVLDRWDSRPFGSTRS